MEEWEWKKKKWEGNDALRKRKEGRREQRCSDVWEEVTGKRNKREQSQVEQKFTQFYLHAE